jgi:histidine ammonia-lyase
MTILRINTFSKGRSGIDPENLKKFINSCNANYFPLIPSKGTVGASGDLCPLAHLALGMMG